MQTMKTEMVGLAGKQVLVKYNIISRPNEQYCPRPDSAYKIFRQSQQSNNLYGKKPPPDIRINRGFTVCLYRNKDIFYRQNICTVLNLIAPSTVTAKKWQLVKICHVSRNLSSCFTATSRGTYPILLFQPNHHMNFLLCICLLPIMVK